MNVNGKHFEIGTIQAFLDGETTPEVSLRLTDHIAGCDACARLMAESDEENAIVFSTLERELNTLVPTQRLWSRINDSIEVEKANVPVWQKALAFVRASLISPSLAAAFGILLILGIFAIVNLRKGPDVVFVTPPVIDQAPVGKAPVDAPKTAAGDQNESNAITPFVAGQSDLPLKEMQKLAQRASAKAGQRGIRVETADYHVPATTAADDRYLPGEESYVKTISDLRPNVESQKDSVMTPSSRVSYERDMAMVNDSIKRMREVVKKNPRNQAARQVLYSSYQDKIDLMNSVAQREELMASLR
jgi:anti-sigma factor RsiW